ncbi:type VI secretion system baseplate subunit TssK [Sulfitobacter sp. M57]|uniref:type VI secretion system baseplate subunit TssK n=1 Tax=unclassified Sulfitobacter TaxID=196795 RepID=UPI0023E32E79|nr:MULTISPECIES: type VI secretion system baseplate subunit TssK [unclassified Sulfitobacter]MDF3416153.1 type VI secretion system baseplate subunit TssK [Sulfitobacter sp. KE5]MDF3423632.1 type VI secretion system baseplate subunit TssK [Sulfitobacter sp. KE43]MDF3434566.1 type VI secretion system baseplate subunit TssK [Sulfitobacter sp. KE42]MDF3460338.1 type VI secretion system baseplate subunit TssK [Sulfitobacter sp. S74]MDF3464104.1 type VI secretion system baseplate subunit TssK [Sulfi
MSWTSKVAWKEGLFLHPHHMQQADRHVERLVQARTADITPYPWGVSELRFNRDLAQQAKIGLTAVAGIFPDGTSFDAPAGAPLPLPVPVPEEEAQGLSIWLTLPDVSIGGQNVSTQGGNAATRYVLSTETVTETSSASRNEQTLEIANPRLELVLRKTPRPGYQNIHLGRIIEMRDGIVTLDDTVPPTGLVVRVHNAYEGYLSRVVGWIEAKLETLARFASDPSSGGGMQATDYLMLMVLNRELPVLQHLKGMAAVHPERLYEKLIGLAGELSTFDQAGRRAPNYARYEHENPKASFTPVVQDIQRLLARDVGRAIRLPLKEVRANSYAALVNDRNLFAQATFVIEVSSGLPLSQVQTQFPQLAKVGPSTSMKQIINNNLPGIGIVHLPNPPRQIRVVSTNVYFVLDKSTELWREFSTAPAIGMHFAGNWPDLKLEMWAIPESA